MLYQLAGGMVVYSETERAGGKFVSFDVKKTVLIVGQPQRNGQIQYQIMRVDKTPFQPKTLEVPWSAVLMVHDVGEPQLLASIKSELSGLTLPPSGLHLAN